MEKDKKVKAVSRVIGICLAVIAILLAVIVVFFYNSKLEKNKLQERISELEKNNNELNESLEENESKNENTFIGINGCFLGEYSDGKWFSAGKFFNENAIGAFKINTKINVNYKEFTYQDILTKPNCYLYNVSNNKLLEEGNLFYNKEEYPEYYTDDISTFRFDTKWDKYGEEYGTFITNKSITDISDIQEIKNIEEYKKYVNDVLKENNINEEGKISKALEVDTNKDGNKEIYIIAENYEINMDDKNNIYNFIVKLEENKAEVIFERIINEKSIANISNMEKYADISSLNFVDFDNDNELEMYIETCVWDIPEIFVFDYNENSEWELCLYGCFAW